MASQDRLDGEAAEFQQLAAAACDGANLFRIDLLGKQLFRR
jgi:hypothetical protein